jgi:hypothetical protein
MPTAQNTLAVRGLKTAPLNGSAKAQLGVNNGIYFFRYELNKFWDTLYEER